MGHRNFIFVALLSFSNILETLACNMDDLRNSGWYCSIVPYTTDVKCMLCGPQCEESFTCSADRGWQPIDNFIDQRCNPTKACFFCPIPSAEFGHCESKGERNQLMCNCKHNNLKYRLFCNQDGRVTGHHIGKEDIKCVAPNINRGGRKLSVTNNATQALTTLPAKTVTSVEFVAFTPPSSWESPQSTQEAASASDATTDEPVVHWLIIGAVVAIVSLAVLLGAVFICLRKRRMSESENIESTTKNTWEENDEAIYDDVNESFYANDSAIGKVEPEYVNKVYI